MDIHEIKPTGSSDTVEETEGVGERYV